MTSVAVLSKRSGPCWDSGGYCTCMRMLVHVWASLNCSLRGAALAWPLTLNLKVIESTAVAVHYHIVIIFKLLPTRGHSITIMK